MGRVSIDQIITTPEFAALTQKQQAFCALMISFGSLTGNYDAEKAASIAYGTKNGQVLGLEMMRQSKIKRVFDIHFAKSPKDAMLEDLHHAIKRSLRKGKTIDQHLSTAIAFYEQESGKQVNRDAK